MKKLFVLLAVTAIALAGFTSMAGATLSFTLGLGNLSLSAFPGPYARVDVTRLDATHASITFTSLTNGGIIYLLGDGGMVGVNVNAGSFAASGVFLGSNSGTGFTPGPFTNTFAGAEDGFGVFNQTISDFDGYSHAVDTFSFTLTNNSGAWASDNDVLTANAQGYRAAAHIFPAALPANASNDVYTGQTGFATEGGTPPVPEPTSMLLLGLGLAGAGVIRRRRKS